MSDFKINVGALKARRKEVEPARIDAVDRVSDDLGFTSREAPAKRGRKPSPRTGQVHAKVFPNVASEIADEARRSARRAGRGGVGAV